MGTNIDNLDIKSKALWGKANPYKPLIAHMIDTGTCAMSYLKVSNNSLLDTLVGSANISKEKLLPIVGYFCALHDIGKVHPFFQLKSEVLRILPDDVRNLLKENGCDSSHLGFRHEKYTAIVLQRIWSKTRFFDNELIDEVIAVLSDHHQKSGASAAIPRTQKEEYELMQDYIEELIYQQFGPDLSDYQCNDWSQFCEGINGLLILSDWLSSNTSFNPIGSFDIDYNDYFKQSLFASEQAMNSVGFVKSTMPNPTKFGELFGWNCEKLRPMQNLVERISSDSPVITIIEDIPGSGKTESSIYLTSKIANEYQKSGFYFALPTAATSNQMWSRLNDVFGRYNIPSFRLMHGMAWSVVDSLRDDRSKYGSEDEIGENWLHPARKGLLSQFAVGTVDQVMMAVLTIRFRALRMLGLTNKVLIIDEIHAYDAYMSTIIERLLEWCCTLKIPVILLSATLPEKKKKAYIEAYTAKEVDNLSSEYPLVSYVTANGEYYQKACESYKHYEYGIHLLPILNNLDKTADEALKLISEGGNLCLMMNTVSDAQKIFKLLEEKCESDVKLLLYHARFKAMDRAKVEKECLRIYSGSGQERPLKSILVCTQVVEQSLDVDFDILMTQICPIDLLVQRMGREWRHNLARPHKMAGPETYILTGDIDKSPMGLVYDPYIIHQTEEYLKKKISIRIPEDLRDAISFVYDSEEQSKEHYENYFNESLQETQAEGAIIDQPSKDMHFLVDHDIMMNDDQSDYVQRATRLGQRTTRVILCNNDLYSCYLSDPDDRSIINKMLDNSLSISVEIPYDNCEQKGILKGSYIAVSDNNSYSINNICKIIYDEKYGAQIIKNQGDH